ncbi:MAG: MipA/OmpV family protein [Deltaproteobacteria bacterium]|jgi:outer membrane scaffolding protein for murein synthesis (MipA/OmpV family)|nr:MipA/OmpV family protein [Deltaproteobacteria bacterium]
MKRLSRIAAAALLILLMNAAQGRAQLFYDEFDEYSDFHGSVGLGIAYSPVFTGAKDVGYDFFPYFKLNYGPVFLNTDKGLGVRLLLIPERLEIAPALNYREPRYDGSSSILNGMGDINLNLTAGGTVTLSLEDLVFSVKTFYGLSNDRGLEVDLRAAYVNQPNERLRWGFMASSSFADATFNRTYFGVTAEQATASGYTAYSPEAGFKDISLMGSVDYFFSPKISLDFFASYTRLIGEAADSPIVQRGSPDQVKAGLLLFYHFGDAYY